MPSKITISLVCSAMILLIFAVVGHVYWQRNEYLHQKVIRQDKLSKIIPAFVVHNVNFKDAVERLRELSGENIKANYEQIEALGIELKNCDITLSLHDVALHDVIASLCRTYGGLVVWDYRNGDIVFTADSDSIFREPSIAIYDVGAFEKIGQSVVCVETGQWGGFYDEMMSYDAFKTRGWRDYLGEHDGRLIVVANDQYQQLFSNMLQQLEDMHSK